MIISQTPFRVSLAGGGTDLPAFYQHERGAVLNLAIRRYLYVTLGERDEPGYRVNCGMTQTCALPEEINHELIRAALALVPVPPPVEISTMADLPAGGGLGSSSTLAVGVLHAALSFNHENADPDILARKACEVEIDIMGKPIGRQDQYAAAFGGVNFMTFNEDHTVNVRRLEISESYRRRLESHLFLADTGRRRRADAILKRQSDSVRENLDLLRGMRDLARYTADIVESETDPEHLGRILHQGWLMKRSLGCGITDDAIDTLYESAMAAGAYGGKLLGAGAGGFLLLVAPPERHPRIRDALNGAMTFPVEIDPAGSRIVPSGVEPVVLSRKAVCVSS